MSDDLKMKIWDFADRPDPSSMKYDNSGGYGRTAISGYWFFKEATKLWGPIGKGWGYEVLEERYNQGANYYVDGNIVGHNIQHTVKIRFWYETPVQNFEQYGSTKFSYLTNAGKMTVDEDVAKKSLTDAIKKALSMLGFANQVYAGEIENYKPQKQEVDNSRDTARREAIERKTLLFQAELSTALDRMESSDSPKEIMAVYKSIARKANDLGDKSALKKIIATKERLQNKDLETKLIEKDKNK